ncbi:transcriptional regulatory [Fusarium mexicanum]|uniref:Transcriptional regulatory n=1 Tax=Fusarium mexicanum TaxID=751941 RepID=A0A8H5JHB6_9HYPO|nr:transcriptional regulatory [Fusarium mexicanum]
MSTVQTPPSQRPGSALRGDNSETSGEATGDGTFSNHNSDRDNQVDATQVQTSSQANNNALRGSNPQRPQKAKSKRGKYISKACNRADDVSSIPSTAFMRPPRQASQILSRLLSYKTIFKNCEMTVAPAMYQLRPLSRHALSTAAQEDPAHLAIHEHTTPPNITPSSTGQPRQPAVNYTFNLELARQHLRAQGSRAGDSEPSDPANPSESLLDGFPVAPDSWNFTKSTIDPLWLIDKQEALRLCHIYEEEIGNSYPFLTLSGLVDNAHKLYDAMEAGSRSGFAFASLPGPPFITADEIDILRLALASALTIETSGSSGLGNALFAKAQERISKPFEKKMAIRMFWSVHTLDRRWSFGAGLPFIIQSNDIDSNIPWPDDEVPYLQAMVAYNRIGAKVWATLYNAGSTASNVPRDDIEFLHYSVERWYKEIPTILKLPEDGAPTLGRGHHRLQILLYLRACQMKILLHQSALHAIPRPARDTTQVKMLVSIAKDMIQKLYHLNQATDIYQTQQVCFNHFLISALGVIFLAVALEPAEYRDTVRQEFNTALDLVRGFSKRSYVSRRLWKMIRGLQQAGVRLGISAPTQEGRTTQATPQHTPRHTNRMPSPLILATPNTSRESPQGSEAWLNNGIIADRPGGFGILDGMEMTLSLDDFLTAAENDDGLWGTSLSPGTSDSLVQGTLNPSIDLAKLDFSQMLDSFL